MSSKDFDDQEKIEFLKEGIENSRNMKAADQEWEHEHGPATRLENLEVEDPLHGPWPRNRDIKYHLDREECGQIRIMSNRGTDISEIADQLWLPEHVVEKHVRRNCDH